MCSQGPKAGTGYRSPAHRGQVHAGAGGCAPVVCCTMATALQTIRKPGGAARLSQPPQHVMQAPTAHHVLHGLRQRAPLVRPAHPLAPEQVDPAVLVVNLGACGTGWATQGSGQCHITRLLAAASPTAVSHHVLDAMQKQVFKLLCILLPLPGHQRLCPALVTPPVVPCSPAAPCLLPCIRFQPLRLSGRE